MSFDDIGRHVKYVDFADIYFTMFCMTLLAAYNKAKTFVALYKNINTKWFSATNKMLNNDITDNMRNDTTNVNNLYNESNKHLKNLERILENAADDLD